MDIQSIQIPSQAQGREMVNWLIAGNTDFASWLKLGLGRDHAPPWQNSPPGSSKTNLVGEAVPKRPNARENTADPSPKNSTQKSKDANERGTTRSLDAGSGQSEPKISSGDTLAPSNSQDMDELGQDLLEMGNGFLPEHGAQPLALSGALSGTLETQGSFLGTTTNQPELELPVMNPLVQIQGSRLTEGKTLLNEEALQEVGLIAVDVQQNLSSNQIANDSKIHQGLVAAQMTPSGDLKDPPGMEQGLETEAIHNTAEQFLPKQSSKEATALTASALSAEVNPNKASDQLAHPSTGNATQSNVASQAASQLFSGQQQDAHQDSSSKTFASEIRGIGDKATPLQNAGHLTRNAEPGQSHLAKDVVDTIRQQLAERVEQMVKQQRSGTVTMHLRPDDLGSLTLQVKAFGNRVDASILASQDSVRHALERDRSQLVQAFEDRGLSLGSMSVGHQSHSESGAWSQGFAQDLRGDWERLGRLVSHQPRDPVTTLRQSPVNKLSFTQERLDVRI